ncbi:MAG: hypothetical protein A2Y17_08050 [Clostridiales bacterium GWF2_38_85]|nr:MAG: hypothetical protein A2Y17_08050 [Clostridiales bacterium GWF2_38_85]HBL83856.1 hypothetical protein [Clostridiales bacterium]
MVTTCNNAVLSGGGNDTRLFVWGNMTAPSYCFYSELVNGLTSAEYFPETNYISLSGHKINDIIRHYDRQIIFTDKGAFYSYDELVTDDMGVVHHSFPVFTLSSQKGNLAPGQATIIDNCPVTVWYDGIYKWVSTNIRDERNAKHISDRVSKMLAEKMPQPNLYPATMFDFEATGELWVAASDTVFVYNYRLDIWYIYDNIPAYSFVIVANTLFFGTYSGKIARVSEYVSDDDGAAIECEWKTPYFDCGNMAKLKELRSLTLMLNNTNANSVDVYWKSDDQAGDATPIAIVTPASTGGTTIVPLRMMIKRFNTAKLIIRNSALTNDASVLSMTLGIKILSKELI